MEIQFWMCSIYRESDQTDINHSSETNIVLRYIEDIVRKVRCDKKELLDEVKNLYPDLQFTLETIDDKNSLPFLDMSINVQPEGTNFYKWYQKPSDTGTILNYRSCAPLQNNKSIIQGIIYRLFHATGNWEAFLEALIKNEEIWENNQYPRHWVGNFIQDTINQLRMNEQRNGPRCNSGVALKQQENTEKQQFVS